MKRKRLNGLDVYVIFSISVVLIYTIAEFIVSSITGVEHSTLTTCLYGFFGGEVVSAAIIKVFKIKHDAAEFEEGEAWRSN